MALSFIYLLLRGFKKVTGEISLIFFSYNLKRAINTLGVEKLLEYLADDKIIKVAA